MQFLFPALAWGFLLVLVPLVIHLINLVRHRRTQWAAMEFLLESYRKNRRWVWLKQALLIASRMLAVAIVVAMLAQWVSGSRWLSFISQTTTHHYVLLDDSASMADTGANGTAYAAALRAIQAIATSNEARDGLNLISIIRTSRAFLASAPSQSPVPSDLKSDVKPPNDTAMPAPKADSVADILARSIPSNPEALLTKMNATTPSSLECGFSEALELLFPLLQQSVAEKPVVYMLSDFRSKDWNNAQTLRQQLQSIRRDDVDLQLVDCVSDRHENLTLESIGPKQEVLAAGVPAMMNITVRNNGLTPARNVTVRVQGIDYSDKELDQKPSLPHSGLITELPPLVFDRIEPGESVTRNVQILFPRSGSHVVEAHLAPDALLLDNSARCVLELQEGIRVLLIDGDPTRKHSFYFESALNPGGATKTGLVMSHEGPEFLRDTDISVLQNYACIFIQAVPAFDPRAIENLHRYVSRGGGLAVFFGEQMSAADYLRYNASCTKPLAGADNSIPLMPFSIKGAADLKPLVGESLPDMTAENHPISAPFFGLSNSPFQLVRVQKYVELENESLNAGGNGTRSTPTAPAWKTVASLRNGQPLLIDHSVGEGRILYGMIAFDRQWTNWPQDPTFVVTALKMVGYLASFRLPETSRLAGIPLRWTYSSQEYLPETQILCPPPSGSNTKSLLNVNAVPSGESMLQANLDARAEGASDETIRAIAAAGNFEWWATTTQGARVVKNFARNTPPMEGDLEKITLADLNRNLNGIKYSYKNSDSLGTSSALAGFSNRNMLLMFLLVALLLIEQWLAWSASYHLPIRNS